MLTSRLSALGKKGSSTMSLTKWLADFAGAWLAKPIGWIALGGALGAVARAWVVKLSILEFGTSFSMGILVVNTLGSVVLGLLAGYTTYKTSLPLAFFAFAGAGFCGSFTTFSTYAVESITLIKEANSVAPFFLNILLNNVFALAGALLGFEIARWSFP